MLTTFIRWFQSPIFPDDEDKTRRALLLNVILNTFLVALPVLMIGILLGGNIPRVERALTILVCAWLTIFGTRSVMLAGQVALAGILTVTIIFITTTLTIYNLGTIRAPATAFYLLVIVIAGLTISRRALLWMVCLAIITINLLLTAETNGFLPEPNLRALLRKA